VWPDAAGHPRAIHMGWALFWAMHNNVDVVHPRAALAGDHVRANSGGLAVICLASTIPGLRAGESAN